VKEKVKHVKWKVQRAKRGFSDCDVWSIDYWFIDVMPKMLSQLMENSNSCPELDEEGNRIEYGSAKESEEVYVKRWKDILSRMIFLLREMDEDTCSMKNPYSEELHSYQREFRAKHGRLGDGLKSKEQLEEEKRSGLYTLLGPRDDPEMADGYNEVNEKYMDFERKKGAYMLSCKDEFFELFSKYFYDLWD